MHIHPSSPNSSYLLLDEEDAARKIQAGFRGYRVRKLLQNPTSYPVKKYHIKSDVSYCSARRHCIMENEHKALPQNDANTSTTSTQQHYKEAISIEDRCATKIQAGIRGFLVRKKQKTVTDAATKIQAGFRGFKVRKETQKLKQKDI